MSRLGRRARAPGEAGAGRAEPAKLRDRTSLLVTRCRPARVWRYRRTRVLRLRRGCPDGDRRLQGHPLRLRGDGNRGSDLGVAVDVRRGETELRLVEHLDRGQVVLVPLEADEEGGVVAGGGRAAVGSGRSRHRKPVGDDDGEPAVVIA